MQFHPSMGTPPELEELLKTLRQVGLYEDTVTIPPTEEGAPKLVILTMYLGDRAFSSKVQDPEQADWDIQFREISRAFMADQFESTRAELIKELGIDE